MDHRGTYIPYSIFKNRGLLMILMPSPAEPRAPMRPETIHDIGSQPVGPEGSATMPRRAPKGIEVQISYLLKRLLRLHKVPK